MPLCNLQLFHKSVGKLLANRLQGDLSIFFKPNSFLRQHSKKSLSPSLGLGVFSCQASGFYLSLADRLVKSFEEINCAYKDFFFQASENDFRAGPSWLQLAQRAN